MDLYLSKADNSGVKHLEKFLVTVLSTLFLMMGTCGWAAIWYVDDDAGEGGDGLSWATAFQSINDAVDAVNGESGNEIWVAEGTYYEYVLLEQYNQLYGGFSGVEESRDERDWKKNQTVVDGQGLRPCVRGSTDVTIDGFVIKNGRNDYGGGMALSYSSATVMNCSFINNKAKYGGAVYNSSYASMFVRCLFSGNTAVKKGGNIYESESSEYINCVIVDGYAGEYGGGIYCITESAPKVVYCTVTGNSAGIEGDGFYSRASCNPCIYSSIFWGNGTEITVIDGVPDIALSCIQGGYDGYLNIDEDPMLGSVRYQPHPDSPCVDGALAIDTSYGSQDFLGNTRILGDAPDMGAFEHLPGSSLKMVSVTVGPTEVDASNPKWRLGLGPWREGSDTVDVYEGDYQIEFSKVINWQEPQKEIVTVSSDTDSLSYQYIKQPGKYIKYVDVNATGSSDGSSWENAFTGLQFAVNATSGDEYSEIWVAEGVYSGLGAVVYSNIGPCVAQVKSGIKMYGGFTGNETLLEQRDFKANETIIDGEGVRRCLYIRGDVTIDGFTLINGDADEGAGVYVGVQSVAAIANCKMENNKASSSYRGGGGLYSDEVFELILTNVHFVDNQATPHGGGIFNKESNIELTGCFFKNNQAGSSGGGIRFSGCDAKIVSCAFEGNDGDADGGGVSSYDTMAVFESCSFTGNLATDRGGAVFSWHNSSYTYYSTFKNCILWGNGTEISDGYTTSTVVSSCVEGGFPGEGNLDTDPMLMLNTTRLLPGSPCIDSGNTQESMQSQTDVVGNPRVQNGQVDMGAYEFVPGTTTSEITIVLGPDEVLSQNPQWRINGEQWRDSGSSVTLYPGSYDIEFTPCIAWKEPVETTVVISDSPSTQTFLYTTNSLDYRWYVDRSANGSEDGRSWDNAFEDIQSAIDAAALDRYGEVWVADGFYAGGGTEAFVDGDSVGYSVVVMEPGVHLYGGFSGDETSLEQRNWEENETEIDGQWTRRCVFGADNATLDGFTISRGKTEYGCGVYNYQASPLIRNCLFESCHSYEDGGAVYNHQSSSPEIINCTFSRNVADESGGAIANVNSSSPVIDGCSFSSNDAVRDGGAVYYKENCTSHIVNCTFSYNESERYGGAICSRTNTSISVENSIFENNDSNYSGGAISSSESTVTVSSCLFESNESGWGAAGITSSNSTVSLVNTQLLNNIGDEGGAISNYSSTLQLVNCLIAENISKSGGGGVHQADSTVTMMNCTLVNNIAWEEGGAVSSESCDSTVRNCILWENNSGIHQDDADVTTVSYSCIQGGFDGEGNIDIDPLMNLDNYIPLPSSPCLDAGDPDVSGLPEFDVVGNDRVQNGRIDMGAMEFVPGTESYAVTIHLGPPEMLVLNPKWKLSDGEWMESGSTMELYPGDYSIEFSPCVNWREPSNTSFRVMDQDYNVTMNYIYSAGRYLKYVDVHATGTGDGSSWQNAFTDIQSAIDALEGSEYAEVWVAAGVYTGGDECVVGMRQNVDLYGGFAGTESFRHERNWKIHQSIIDGEKTRRCVNCKASHRILNGFTLMNGANEFGGGMYLEYAISTVANCTFTRNYASNGAGVYNSNSLAKFLNCQFYDNYSMEKGAGVYNVGFGPTLENCLLVNNKSDVAGGAMYNNSSDPVVLNCTIIDNASSDEGSEIANFDSFPVVENSIVWGGGVAIDDINSTPTIVYSCVKGGLPGEGNIDQDPLLSPEYFLLTDSPCIDMGNPDVSHLPESDLNGEIRVQNSRVDLGCYEFVPGTVASEVTVTLGPAEVLSLNPLWRIDGGPWMESGAVVSVYQGNHSIEFTSVLDWREPEVSSIAVTTENHFMQFDYSAHQDNYRWYVDVDASGSGSGQSWADAFTDIQSAISAASSEGFGEVWVAEGTYRGVGGEASARGTTVGEFVVVMADNIHLYGGFSGEETSRDERNWEEHQVTIDGEYVRLGLFGADQSTLDGFTVTNCRGVDGGAMYNNCCSLDISNCIFTINKANYDGAGMYNHMSYPVISKCLFWGNEAASEGGGIFSIHSKLDIAECAFKFDQAKYGGGVHNHHSSMEMIYTSFDECEAESGAGIYSDFSPNIFVKSSTFNKNSTDHSGAGIFDDNCIRQAFEDCTFRNNTAGYSGAGIFSDSYSLTITNCSFDQNTSGYDGGGIKSSSSTKIINSTFTGNHAGLDGGGAYGGSPSLEVVESTFTDNSANGNGGGICSYRSTLKLSGCELRSNVAGENGGGLFEDDWTSFSGDEIFNCKFVGNHANRGGGLSNSYYHYSKKGSLFPSGWDLIGDGKATKSQTAFVKNCLVADNTADDSGGGVYSYYHSSSKDSDFELDEKISHGPLLMNCNILGNRAKFGGGVYNISVSVLKNCIVWGNSSGIVDDSNDTDLVATYCCIQGGYSGQGNIDTDPQLNAGYLSPLPSSSCLDAGDPGLDDLPETDMVGSARVQNGRVDMGACEAKANRASTTLTVTLGPDEILPYEPQWRFQYGQWNESGASVEVYPGEYQLEFLPVANWMEPQVSSVVVSSSESSEHYNYIHSPGNGLWFVDVDAVGGNDGSSWENAFTDIQSAINAVSEAGEGDIWVAEGTYSGVGGTVELYPIDDPVEFVVLLSPDVHLYGGFAGDETDRFQRDWETHLTIIDGENIRSGLYGTDSCTLDGFVVRNGYGDYSGGMNNLRGSSPTVRNTTFEGNFTKRNGGGMYNDEHSSPLVINCKFTGNHACSTGGGVSNYNGSCPDLINCIFTGNKANRSGGGVYCRNDSDINLINCTLTGNSASVEGGGIYVYDSTPNIQNCIFWNNGSEIERYGSSPRISYCCIQGGYNNGQGIIESNPLINTSCPRPLSSSPCIDAGSSESLDLPPTDFSGGDRILNGRVDIGAYEYVRGSSASKFSVTITPEEVLELGVKWRIDDGPWLESGTILDVYEGEHRLEFSPCANWQEPQDVIVDVSGANGSRAFDYTSAPGKYLWHVNQAATGDNNGRSWRNAFTSIQPAILAASVADYGEVWVANGTYTGSDDYIVEMAYGVAMYGGFAGGETSRLERYWRDHQTILDGESARSCVRGANLSLIDGLCLTNAKLAMASYYANPTVRNCLFRGNTTSFYGSAIYSSRSCLTIVNCEFIGNENISSGGCVRNYYNSSPLIENCVFFQNSTNYSGAAIVNDTYSCPLIVNCTIVGNKASSGDAGISNYDHSSPLIENCILWGNEGDIYSNDGSYPDVVYSCVEEGYFGEGNITTDPRFVDLENGDLGLSYDSSCVDSGTSDHAPDTDIRDYPRPFGARVDMGAYEYWAVSPPPEVIMTILGYEQGNDNYDLNSDGIIDAADLVE